MKLKNAALVLAAVLVWSAVFAKADGQKEKKGKAKQAVAAAPEEQRAPTTDVNDPGYIIGAEDVLNINVWKEPELTRQGLPVRPDGKITLPLINDIQAAGLTPLQLKAEITRRLTKYVDDPQVTVTVTNVNSRRIYILGQVGRAGAYPLLPEMTVLQALSTAGGLSPYAAGDKIYVLRNENGSQVKIAFHYKKVIKGERPQENILLRSGDTVVVP